MVKIMDNFVKFIKDLFEEMYGDWVKKYRWHGLWETIKLVLGDFTIIASILLIIVVILIVLFWLMIHLTVLFFILVILITFFIITLLNIKKSADKLQ